MFKSHQPETLMLFIFPQMQSDVQRVFSYSVRVLRAQKQDLPPNLSWPPRCPMLTKMHMLTKISMVLFSDFLDL